MIRTRAWTYIHRHPYGPHELYDLAIDPWETVNLVEDPARRGARQDLRATLEGWFQHHADPPRDGSREGVTGLGQVGLAGPAPRGRESYRQADGTGST